MQDMFNDHFEDLMIFLKEKIEEDKKKKEIKEEKDDTRLQGPSGTIWDNQTIWHYLGLSGTILFQSDS